MDMNFNINDSFTLEVIGAWEETTTIIFCDYTRKVTIIQNGEEISGRAGFCGRDKTKSDMKYLFVGDRVYFLDELTRVFFNQSEYNTDFPKWLVL